MKAFLLGAVLVTPLAALAHGYDKKVDAATVTPLQMIGKLKAKDRMHTDLASIASTQGSSVKVRSFADKIVKDHEKLGTDLQQYAKDTGITFADAERANEQLMDKMKSEAGEAGKSWKAMHEEKLDRLRGMNGAKF